jgi:prepilin-type N-terminal cleavage/methylation domain-containing protein
MSRGFTLLELMTVIAIIAVISGAAVSFAHSMIDRSRTSAAASYMSSRIALARFEAVKRSAFVAIQFVDTPDGYLFRTYFDGNHNGVLSRDIARGIDRPITTELRLDQQFPGIGFGIYPEVTAIDPTEPLNLNDPIQIGNSTLMSFSPNGSCTAGTLYIRGPRANQFAVRVLGITGRSRILHFDFQEQKWRTP